MVVVGHDLLHHLLGQGNWAFHDLWLGVSTVASSICVRIRGTRMSISSTSFTPSQNSCFLALMHKDFNHGSRFLKALTTARLLLQPSNLSSGCSLETRNTLVHIVARTRLQNVDRALGDHELRYHAGLHRPVKSVGLVGCRVLVVCGHTAASFQQPPDRSQYGCTVGIDRDPPVRYLHPSKLVEVPERQLLPTWLHLVVLSHTWSCLLPVVLW